MRNFSLIIVWKADYDGTDIQSDLKRLHRLQLKIQKKVGGKVEGPYFPQDASVLYIFHMEEYAWLHKAGRIYFSEVAKQNLAFVPQSYEVAVTPEEFFEN
ncbi:MAG TPA: hypothetical protein VJN71_10695 [Nitrososphaerales archaeon]|nr:hypothetical protein [Nitrososphaerales archaeon]